MTRNADISDHENLLIAGLIQKPERLAELRGFEGDWFSTPECKLSFLLLRDYHRRAAARGQFRYATPAALERIASEWGSRSEGGGDDAKRRGRKRRSMAEAVVRVVADSRAWALVDEHEFREACDAVRDRAADEKARASLMDLADQFAAKGARGVFRELSRITGEIAQFSTNADVATLGTDARNALAEYARTKKDPGAGRTPTQFAHLNRITGGGRATHLWLVCAYAKDGKTQCAKELIYYAGTVHQRGCLVITHEQTKEDVRVMMIARHSHLFIDGGLPTRGIEDGSLSKEQEAVLQATVADLEAGAASGAYGQISYWKAPGGTTMADVRSMIDSTARRHPVDVVMLDHTMLFRPTHSTRSPVDDLSGVIREAKDIAMDSNGGKGLWMIAPHQIKREGYEKALDRGFYLPSDAGGTSEAERSADAMVTLLQTQEMRDMFEIRMGVPLVRRGEPEPKGWQCWQRFSHAALLALDEGPISTP